MARTRVRSRRIMVLLGVILATMSAARGALGDAAGPPRSVDRYVVRPGDTLWDIAQRRVGSEGDPRPMVEAIRQANRLAGSEIAAGQSLLLP